MWYGHLWHYMTLFLFLWVGVGLFFQEIPAVFFSLRMPWPCQVFRPLTLKRRPRRYAKLWRRTTTASPWTRIRTGPTNSSMTGEKIQLISALLFSEAKQVFKGMTIFCFLILSWNLTLFEFSYQFCQFLYHFRDMSVGSSDLLGFFHLQVLLKDQRRNEALRALVKQLVTAEMQKTEINPEKAGDGEMVRWNGLK